MKAFKAFIKPLEAPQRSVKKKVNLIFSLCPGLGRKGLIRSYIKRLYDATNLTK